MAFTVSIVPFQLSDTEDITNAKLNQLGNPTAFVTGTLSDMSNWNVVSAVSKAFTVHDMADDILLCTAHGLPALGSNVDAVVRAVVSTTGVLPAGLTASTTYFYYVRVVDADKLTLHRTAVGALLNTDRLNVTSAGSGTNTLTWTVYALGQPVGYNSGTSKFELAIVKRDGLPEMLGASSTVDGARGGVPQPQAGDQTKFLQGDGTWAAAGGGGGGGSSGDLFNSMTHY